MILLYRRKIQHPVSNQQWNNINIRRKYKSQDNILQLKTEREKRRKKTKDVNLSLLSMMSLFLILQIPYKSRKWKLISSWKVSIVHYWQIVPTIINDTFLQNRKKYFLECTGFFIWWHLVVQKWKTNGIASKNMRHVFVPKGVLHWDIS